MRENEHVPSNVPYLTRTGVKIGLLYQPPSPATHRDGDRLQKALLMPDDDPMDDLGRLAIGIVSVLFAAALAIALMVYFV
jgi:hypothetical protein